MLLRAYKVKESILRVTFSTSEQEHTAQITYESVKKALRRLIL